MNRSQLRGDLPEPVSRYFDEVVRLQPPNDLLTAVIGEIERSPRVNRFSPLATAGLAAAAVIGIALFFSAFFSSTPSNVGGEATPIPSVTPTPTAEPVVVASPPAEARDAKAFLLAEGDGPGGPWAYWVWMPDPDCGPAQMVESSAFGSRGPIAITEPSSIIERCMYADNHERFGDVDHLVIGPDDGVVSFVYGRTRLDVVRVTVRTVDGSEFEVETIAAPDDLGVDSERYVESRFYVAAIPVHRSEVATVRGYDASGQEFGQ